MSSSKTSRELEKIFSVAKKAMEKKDFNSAIQVDQRNDTGPPIETLLKQSFPLYNLLQSLINLILSKYLIHLSCDFNLNNL